MDILIVMSSLLNNLGPRYSRRNGTTPIILGFLLLIIGIAVVTYFITRDDKGDKDKKEDDDGETVPSIGDLTIKRTLNPDSSNSSESGTETYEICGGKIETYQIEYNNGISDTELSKNVTIDITWNNKNGFEKVYKLEIEHYVTDPNVNSISSVPSGTKTITNADYFANYATGLTHSFKGDGTYKFVGINTIAIKAWYGDADKTDDQNVVVDLYRGKLENARDRVTISSEDLAATTNLTVPLSITYRPFQSNFKPGKTINNQPYNANTVVGNIDIYKSISGNTDKKAFTLIRASDSNNNDYYFKFSDTEYLGYTESDDGVKNLTISETKGGASIITLVVSPKDDGDDDTFRLEFTESDGTRYYIVIDDNENGVLKQRSELDSEAVFNTLDWKISLPP